MILRPTPVPSVDFTLFDHVSAAERAEELARPHVHSFLTNAYRDYDIIIWSATASMKWIELKMVRARIHISSC